MNLIIDKFYQHKRLGVLKFKGYDNDKIVFDQYVQGFGKWNVERLAIDPRLNKNTISELVEALPPQ